MCLYQQQYSKIVLPECERIEYNQQVQANQRTKQKEMDNHRYGLAQLKQKTPQNENELSRLNICKKKLINIFVQLMHNVHSTNNSICFSNFQIPKKIFLHFIL